MRLVYLDAGDREEEFQKWYAKWADIAGISPDPNPDLHKYDYRKAFLAGVEPTPDKTGEYHWPSRYKYHKELEGEDHPARYVDGKDTAPLGEWEKVVVDRLRAEKGPPLGPTIGLEGVRARRSQTSLFARVRRLALWMLVDAGLIVLTVAGTAIARPRVVEAVQETASLSPGLVSVLFVLLAAAAALPFALGVVRCVRRLGGLLAAEVLPQGASGLDLAAAPRRALVAGLQSALLLIVALPVLALTQPFLPPLPGVGALAWCSRSPPGPCSATPPTSKGMSGPALQ